MSIGIAQSNCQQAGKKIAPGIKIFKENKKLVEVLNFLLSLDTKYGQVCKCVVFFCGFKLYNSRWLNEESKVKKKEEKLSFLCFVNNGKDTAKLKKHLFFVPKKNFFFACIFSA